MSYSPIAILTGGCQCGACRDALTAARRGPLGYSQIGEVPRLEAHFVELLIGME
jgi:hypothetical protein